MDYDTVVAELEDEGFKSINTTEVYDDSPIGTIVEQNLLVGEPVVPEETDIEFTISKGPELITIIDLTGYTLSDVRKYAESNGLIEDVSQEEFHDTIPKGKVIDQTPQVGAKIEKGSTIKVVFSKGPEELPFKQVKEEIMIPYEPFIEEQGEVQEGEVQEGEVQEGEVQEGEVQEEEQEKPQHVQIFIEDVDNNITELYDEYMITEDTTVPIELTIAHGTVGRYRVMRDNQVIFDESVPYPE
jgi:eukaryotic-like serine/threonine-protein kinase